MQDTQVRSLRREDLCILSLCWWREWLPTPAFLPGRIPGTEEPGGLRVHAVTKSCVWLRDWNTTATTKVWGQELTHGEVWILHILSQTVTWSVPSPPRSLLDWARTHHICYVPYTLLGDFIFLSSFHCQNSRVTLVLLFHLADEGNETQTG